MNVDHGHVHRVEHFDFVPGIFELARFAVGTLGWRLIVITNQSGIGRGLFDEATYEALTCWMSERFAAENAPLARVYHCPYHPEHGIGDYRRDHPWRKPQPGMILQAAADFDLDLPGSVLIGDRLDDVRAAAAAGIGLTIRLEVPYVSAVPGLPPHEVVATLANALALLKRRFAPPG